VRDLRLVEVGRGQKKLKIDDEEVFNSRSRAKKLKNMVEEGAHSRGQLCGQSTKQDQDLRTGKNESRGEGSRGINLLRDADEEAVDDVEEELEQELQGGEEVVKGMKEKPFGCSGCSKKFALKHHLQLHTANKHQAERPFKCKVTGCSKDFGSKQSLNIHMAFVHLAKKDFQVQGWQVWESFWKQATTGKPPALCRSWEGEAELPISHVCC